MKYLKPRNFEPSQEDLTRVGKKIAEQLSPDKVVIAGDKKINGIYKRKNDAESLMKPDPVKYGDRLIEDKTPVIEETGDKVWLSLREVFLAYKTSYKEIIIELASGHIIATIVGGEVYFNSKEMDKVGFKRKMKK